MFTVLGLSSIKADKGSCEPSMTGSADDYDM